MKKKRWKNMDKMFLIFSILGISTIPASLYFLSKTNPQIQELVVINKTEKNIHYPAQYSDKHITKNAIVSDERFRNIAFVDKENLLANTINSIKTGKSEMSQAPEKGTWLWTPILDITPEYRKSIITGAKKNGVRNIYLSIDSYLDIYIMQDGQEKNKKKKAFDKNVEDFIREARENDMTVDAEGGWRNWAEKGHQYKALAILDYAIRFNTNQKEKFRGFQYDVEPYLLDSYQKDKEVVLKNFLILINESLKRLSGTDLELSVVIPEFYDEKSGETPKFTFNGKNGYTIDHLISILDRRQNSKIIVMSYRNWSHGENGSIEISKEEVEKANKGRTKIVIAQETGDVEPPHITFYNTSKSHYNKQIKEIEKAFAKDKSFSGTATHYVNALLEL